MDSTHKTIGKYEVVDLVGTGSMGAVYRGHDPFSERFVAIKVAHPEQLADQEHGRHFRKLFFNEAHALGLLDHPNILKTFDANIEGDYCYIVMEYVHGAKTLQDHVQAPNLLSIGEVVRFLYKIAKALDYAHQEQVIHRDIKPSNIIITDDRDIKLADFSVAFVNRADMKSTQVTGFIGSPLYMSPEQILEREVTYNSDLFSLGVVAYQLIAGCPPFQGNNLEDVARQIVQVRPEPIRVMRPDCPPSLAGIIDRLLEKDPGKRFVRALDVAVELAFVYEELSHGVGMENDEALRAIRSRAFFALFSDDELRELARASTIETRERGATIIREREQDHAFFVILEGVVSVSKDGKAIDDLQAGDCFGEMGFLSHASRSATVSAKTGVQLLRVNKEIIDSVSEGIQLKFYKTFVDVLIRRLGETTSSYLHLLKI